MRQWRLDGGGREKYTDELVRWQRDWHLTTKFVKRARERVIDNSITPKFRRDTIKNFEIPTKSPRTTSGSFFFEED